MKIILWAVLLILPFSAATAKGGGKDIKTKDVKKKNRAVVDTLYEQFVGQLVTINGNSAAPSAVLEISDQPNLKFNIPFYQGYKKQKNTRYALYADAKVGASNGYSVLMGKGSWKPNTDANLSGVLFAPRSIRHYQDEATTQAGADAMPLAEASSINYGWFFGKAGVSYAEYNLYNDAASKPFDSRVLSTVSTSGNFRFGYSYYYFPSRNHLKALSFFGTAFAEHKTNDNNYNTLTKVDVERLRVFNGTDDSSILVTDSKISAAKGKYISGSSYSLGGELTMIIAPENSKLVIGLGAGLSRKFFNEQSYSTATFTLNLPVTRKDGTGKETTVNIAIKAELPDICGENNLREDLDQRARVGFTVGLPLPNHKAKKG